MEQEYIDPERDSFDDLPAPRYPGEDTRLTSRKELAGWYSYGWAAEVFVVCGVGMISHWRQMMAKVWSILTW